MKKVNPPQLPAVLENTELVLLVDDTTIESCKIENADFTSVTAKAVSLDEVILERTLFSEAKLDKFGARDTVFTHCDFSAAHCADGSFLRVTFLGGRMSGWDSSESVCKDVTFKNCKLDMANFRFAKLTSVRFISCVLTEADFLNAQLQDVSFEDCLLERTEFAQCKMKNVDLRTSQLIELKGWQSLKGATIDNVQLMSAAPYLANEIGIKISDE